MPTISPGVIRHVNAEIIQAEELDGSPSEFHNGADFTATREIQCAWNLRYSLAAIFENTLYPYLPTSLAICTGIVIKPFGKLTFVETPREGQPADPYTGYNSYEKARLTLTYTIPQTTFGEIHTVEVNGIQVAEAVEPNAEFITLDPKDYKWSDDDTLEDAEAPGFLIRSFDWSYTQYDRPQLPVSILSLPGSCNAALLQSPSLGLTFPPETLMFRPPSIIRKDVEKFDVTFKFGYRPNTWNKVWRAKTQQWEAMYRKDTGVVVKNYPPLDWQSLGL